MEERMDELEKKQNAELKKFAEMLDRFGGELYGFQQFLESLLIVLLDISLLNEPTERLAALFKASTFLPTVVMKTYLRTAIGKSHRAGMKYGELFDALIKSFGDSIKDLDLTNVIKRFYGARVAEKWEEMLKNSNPSIASLRDVKML